MWEIYRSFMNWFTRLDREELFFALVAVMLIGFFCMRGFGSRSSY